MKPRAALIASVIVLSACGGGASPSLPSSTAASPSPTGSPRGLVPTSFVIVIPTTASSTVRRPAYVGAGVHSVTITLDSVDGQQPPSGLTLSVTSNLSAPCPAPAGCTVSGPNVPPGNDAFTITTYDGANGTGAAVSIGTQSLQIAPGVANAVAVTLAGIPRHLAIAATPTGTAGTAYSTPQSLAVTVQDADFNTIVGQYASPVTVTDSDSSGGLGSALSVNGSAPASSVTLNASTDVLTLSYGGLAIAPALITASAPNAAAVSVHFSPILQAMSYTGSTVNGSPEVDLYAASGTGSSANISLAELGWSNAPFNRAFTLSVPSACSTIAAASPASGTSFTITALASPGVGTCTITFHDGTGQSTNVIVTYSSTSFGIQ